MFLSALAETCQKTGWQVHAWCLMSNHFHLVIETPQGNLVAGMKWLLGWGFKPPKQRPPWLRVDRVLGEAGISRDTVSAAE